MSSWTRGAAAAALTLALAGCERPPFDAARAAEPTAVACPQAAADSGDTAAVVKAARAFAARLDDRRRAALTLPLTLENARRWSNFPASLVRRAGVPFGDLDPAQTAAANALILTAAGACGATLFAENRLADVVGQKAIPGVNPAAHYISFNGEPSETAPWMLMIGGHHIAYNFVFNTGEPGATPLFAGSDPARFIDEAGVARDPTARQRAALSALAQAVEKYPQARLPGVYTDLVKSVVGFSIASTRDGVAPRGAARPGTPNFGIDANYPLDYPTGPDGRGVRYDRLTPAEQALVRQAIGVYAALPGRRISAPLLAEYLRPDALADTYVAFSGDTRLEDLNAYLRIDGPRVWIELSVQRSLVDAQATHFHSVWRDKRSDYGGRFRS
jgi:hypothetical protein